MKLKVRYSSIIKFNIFLLLTMQLGYTKLLGNVFPIFSTSYIPNPLVMFYLAIGCITILLSLFYSEMGSRMISIEFLIMLIVVTIGLINTSEKYSVDFIFIAASALNYLYFFLALPVYKILRLERIEFRKFLKILTFLCAGSYVIRGAISLYYVATGVDILPAIALEGAAVGWIRNGVLRINPPCLGLIYLPITFYLYSTAEKLKQRVLYVGMIVLGVWYMTYITQARSMMIYQICILILLLMLKNKPNSRKGIIGTALLICVVVYLINSPAAEKLIASFSASNTETGASTVARFNAISYFGMQFLQKPLSGIGLLLGRDTRTPIGGDISDIGLLRSVYMLGVGMALLYLVIFIRGVYVAYKARKVDFNISLLVLGMTLLIILTNINIDSFWDIFAFAMPFYISIVEYSMCRIRMIQENEEV